METALIIMGIALLGCTFAVINAIFINIATIKSAVQASNNHSLLFKLLIIFTMIMLVISTVIFILVALTTNFSTGSSQGILSNWPFVLVGSIVLNFLLLRTLRSN